MIARLFRFSLPRGMSSFPRKMSTSPRGMSLLPRGMSLSSGVYKLPFYRQIPQIEQAHSAENKILFPRKMSLSVFGVGTHRICLLFRHSKPGNFAMCIYTCCACYSSKTKRSESISPAPLLYSAHAISSIIQTAPEAEPIRFPVGVCTASTSATAF